jgi:hypothetical protein
MLCATREDQVRSNRPIAFSGLMCNVSLLEAATVPLGRERRTEVHFEEPQNPKDRQELEAEKSC